MKHIATVSGKTFGVLGMILIATCSPASALEDADSAITAESVVASHIEACGGDDALRAVESRRIQGSLVRHGQKVPVELLQAAPNRWLMATKFPRPGTLVQGFDGTVGWVLHPTRGGSILEGDGLETLADEAWMHRMLHLRKLYQSIAYEKYDPELREHVLRMTKQNDDVERWRFSADTGRLRSIEKPIDLGPKGEAVAIITLGDYRESDGVFDAWEIHTTLPNVETTLIVEALENNVDIDESVFSPDF